MRLNFTPNVDLGHIIQALVVAGGLGGWAIVGYITIEEQISRVNHQMDLQTQRTETDEHTLSRVQDSQDRFSAEMRTELEKISDKMSDIRVLIPNRK